MTARIHVISQHFPPDTTSTAKYLAAVAEELSETADVVAVSGTPDPDLQGRASVKSGVSFVHIENHQPEKNQLFRRAIAMSVFAFRVLRYCLTQVRRGEVIVAVTTPYTVTYAVGLAARIARRRAVLMLYDLYPDVLVQAGMLRQGSLQERLLMWLNRRVLKGYASMIVIGRDMERRVSTYVDTKRTRVHYIPMWSDIDVDAVPPMESAEVQRFRPKTDAKFILALSGNLGFTHDPETVFEAARILRDNPDVHFLLSGWGVGWKRLKALQEAERLANVTIVEAVSEADLGAFLMAGDLWMIPYKGGMAGVSVPSRFYNLLALGKPVITLAEASADHSLIITESDIGWVVPPGAASELAETLRSIARQPAILRDKGLRAKAKVAARYTRAACGVAYRKVISELPQTR